MRIIRLTKLSKETITELTRELANYYATPCVIWTTPTIAKQMITPYLSDSRQWLVVKNLTALRKRKIDSQTEFVQYSDGADLKVDGQKRVSRLQYLLVKNKLGEKLNKEDPVSFMKIQGYLIGLGFLVIL